ncbi:ABC transporter ATP-binding protein [Candidatus Leptofilum sp.]|uniref:ABC transporter ATP-binding protein n=1 Tax=Candidatus Leptofilum sp. TaxID=3241576 RepID=UPI003B5AE435
MQNEIILDMQGIRKQFGSVVALDDVSLTLKRGEIHGLLGGNGAGKTTLMNVLYGLYRADRGTIAVAGKPLDIRAPKDAIEGGIGMVHQQFLQVNRFTVAENIVLGTSLQQKYNVNLKAEKETIRELGQRFGLPIDPDKPIHLLPMGIRQRVEILKALYRGVKILILDEPTTNLTPQEVDALFASLRTMVEVGLTVVFITHKLREVLEVCDRITVLRHGRNVLTLNREEASEEAFIKGMVGDDLDPEKSLQFASSSLASQVAPNSDTAVLQVNSLTVGSNTAVPDLYECSLAVLEGEIVGIAGVAGNGQLELAESLLGLRTISSGEVMINGRNVAHLSTHELLGEGVAYIPEDRWQDGFLAKANVAQNLILGLHRREPYSNGRFLNWSQIFQRSKDLIQEFDIKTQGPTDTAGNLSGGNIQRVMLARAFSQPVRFLIAHNPTRGLDIPSMEFIYKQILQRQEAGMATLLISENMDELFLLSNRIVAICNGAIMGELQRHEFDRYTLGRMMSGVKQSE